jgi:hypothetical protein
LRTFVITFVAVGLLGISLSLIEVFPFDVPFLVSEESVKVIQVGEWDDMLFNIVIVVGGV